MTEPSRDPQIPDLVTLVEAADMLKVSRQAMHKMASEGRLPGVRLAGGVWVFRRVVVEEERRQRS